jgi:glutamate synthase domain-containing protein 1
VTEEGQTVLARWRWSTRASAPTRSRLGPLAHPYRYIAHNGEINTLRGNINWMHAREALFASELFGDDMQKILPDRQPRRQRLGDVRQRARAALLAGRSLPHAMMMMIPEPWSATRDGPEKRAFYEYHSCLMEPWDGPASIAFTDGT